MRPTNVRRALLVAATLLVGGSLCQAQVAPGAPWQYFGAGAGTFSLDYVPYFSMHPPVYYSRPVPRTYGYSPFAYPPGTMTPDVAWMRPEVLMNPFVPGANNAAEKPKRVAHDPVRLENPFVAVKHVDPAAL